MELIEFFTKCRDNETPVTLYVPTKGESEPTVIPITVKVLEVFTFDGNLIGLGITSDDLNGQLHGQMVFYSMDEILSFSIAV